MRRASRFLKEHARQVRDHIKTLGREELLGALFARAGVGGHVPAGRSAAQHRAADGSVALRVRRRSAGDSRVAADACALLRTVATAWQQQRLAENAEEIQAMGRELYERLTTMAEHVAQVGSALNAPERRTTTSWARSTRGSWCRRAASATSGSAQPKELPDISPAFISKCANREHRNCGSRLRNH